MNTGIKTEITKNKEKNKNNKKKRRRKSGIQRHADKHRGVVK